MWASFVALRGERECEREEESIAVQCDRLPSDLVACKLSFLLSLFSQASQLSDSLVELLLALGDEEGARDVVSQCLSARMQVGLNYLACCLLVSVRMQLDSLLVYLSAYFQVF